MRGNSKKHRTLIAASQDTRNARSGHTQKNALRNSICEFTAAWRKRPNFLAAGDPPEGFCPLLLQRGPSRSTLGARVKTHTSRVITNQCGNTITHPGQRTLNGFSILTRPSVGRSGGTSPVKLLTRLPPSGRASQPKVGEHGSSRANFQPVIGAAGRSGTLLLYSVSSS